MPSDSLNKYLDVLQEFLAARGWTDEPSIDEEGEQISLVSGITIGEQGGKLIIELSYAREIVDVYIYFNIYCLRHKSVEMAVLFNEIHQRWAYGRFVIQPDAGVMRWQHRVDFEGSSPSGLSLERVFGPGWNCVEEYEEVIRKVALTDLSASDATALLDD